MLINQFLINLERLSQSLSRKFVFFKIFKPIYFFGSLLLLSIISFSIIINENLKKKRVEEINSFLSNNQTLLLRNYIFNKIKSPYLEYDYVVKNNDTIENIFKKFSVKKEEIAFVVKEIKKQNLSNISPGQKIKFILKKSKNKEDLEIFKVNYPISKTTFVRIDKRKDGIEISKNVTQLYKLLVILPSTTTLLLNSWVTFFDI